MSTDPAISNTPGAVRSFFDEQHYALNSRSPRSDHSGPFDSQSSSRRPSAMERGQSPVARSHAPTENNTASFDRTPPSLPFANHARTPSEAHSIQSTSSSLRQAYDVLRGGVFPPGMRHLRRGDDEIGSDACHYGDEDGYSFEGEGPFRPSSPHANQSNNGSSSMHRNTGTRDSHDPLESPTVPERRSSATRMQGEPLSRLGSKRGSGQSKQEELAFKAIASARQKSSQSAESNQRSYDTSPTMKSVASHPSNLREHEDSSSSDHARTLPVGDMTELERQLEAAAAADPNRPRTLKEARALAKERARMRLQAKEGSDATISADTSSIALRQHPPTSAKDVAGVEGSRADHRMAQVISNPRQTTGDKRPSVATIRPDALHDMSSLQAAVGEALDDVSFHSGTTSTTMASGAPNASAPSVSHSNPQTPKTPTASLGKLLAVTTETDRESIAPSIQSFDSAPESPFTSAAHIPNYTSTIAAPDRDGFDSTDQPPTIQVIHTPASHMRQASGFGVQPTSMPFGIPTERPKTFHPHPLHSHQRSTAPNKIARLDVYGKSVPWPAAFDPAAIVEQKRLAPWERARSYAHYCNDLMSIQTGLQVWLEMVQRPAQRANVSKEAPGVGNAIPSSRQLRGERTDGSYAASVRSDATFPMRGDGAKAKELHAHQPSEASIAESPPAALPANLPYPMLANQQAGSPGLSSPVVRHQAKTSQDSGLGHGSLDKQNSRSFFSNLGRRSSTRRPTHPSISGLSGVTASGSSSTLARNRGLSHSSTATSNAQSSDSSATTVTSPASPFISSTQRGAPVVSSPSPSSLPSTASTTSLARNGPQGPRALGNVPVSVSGSSIAANAPPYFGSLSTTPTALAQAQQMAASPSTTGSDKIGLHGVTAGGGLYSVPAEMAADHSSPHLNAPTDYSAATGSLADRRSPRSQAVILPPSTSVKSSLSYGSVREARRPTLPGTLYPPPSGVSSSPSSDSHGSAKQQGGHNGGGPFAQLGLRRGSAASTAAITPEESDALDKLSDVLPDADRNTLLEYLRRANGNDLVAIGDYLQNQSKEASSKLMR